MDEDEDRLGMGEKSQTWMRANSDWEWKRKCRQHEQKVARCEDEDRLGMGEKVQTWMRTKTDWGWERKRRHG